MHALNLLRIKHSIIWPIIRYRIRMRWGRIRTQLKVWSCRGMHDWTCAAGEGVKPTALQLSTGLAGFYDYARMYCNRCGYEYARSRALRQSIPIPTRSTCPSNEP
jgi:hypothetical protein